MIMEFQVTKVLPKDVNSTFISLIPKVTGAKYFSKFQPINICNFVHKIMSKVLTN